MLDIHISPIGSIHEIGEGRSLLEILSPYQDGLYGLQPGHWVQVLYWMHELAPADRPLLRGHPCRDYSKPERGVFALRSPFRPNPIGVSEVEVVEVLDNGLIVTGLDARDGSPLIDIKWANR